MYNLGLTSQQLWRLRLKEFYWLSERYYEEIEYREESAAMRLKFLVAELYNSSGVKKKNGKPFTVKDFEPKSNHKQTVEEQKIILSQIGVM